jgi:hypothetical protein
LLAVMPGAIKEQIIGVAATIDAVAKMTAVAIAVIAVAAAVVVTAVMALRHVPVVLARVQVLAAPLPTVTILAVHLGAA